ncbi:protein of unknown function (DUF4781) [Popillia japonica]|uniref:Uncharacterized protein n=1 Tax=Popillia japonica TaxID=7064 RepID=A0AAW1I6U6_POPJA
MYSDFLYQCLTLDLIEEISCYEFQKFFYSEYKKSKLDLLSESLQSCLSEVVNKEKPLIFVLYDENNSKSRQLCESLSNPEIENIISEHFLILGWKIKNDQEYCDRLAVKVLIVEEVFRCLKSCKSGIFIIIPNDKTVEVYKTIETDEDIKTDYDSGDNVESNTNNNELFAALTQTQQLLGFYSFGNSLKNLTSTKYQQMMSDELGDRDFDSFEHNEHELLENKILYALYGPPKQQNDNIGYEETQMKKVKKLYETIRDTNNKYSKWKDRIVIAFIYNCTEPPATEKEDFIYRQVFKMEGQDCYCIHL